MKFYPKNLESLKDLKKEKQRLAAQARQYNPSTWLGSTGKSGDSHADSTDLLGSLISGVPALFRLFSGKKKKKVLAGFAKELLGGYLKWKVAYLILNGLSLLLREKKK